MHYNMIKKAIIVGLIELFSWNLYSQVTTNEIYDALNQLIEINNVTVLNKKTQILLIKFPSQNEFLNWCISSGPDKILRSQIDSAFILIQTNNSSVLKWDKKKINRKIKFDNIPTDSFTIPLFLNCDMNLFIVWHEEYVGRLMSQGKYELYKKVGAKWKLINQFLYFVS
jgi:hypothetical protein